MVDRRIIQVGSLQCPSSNFSFISPPSSQKKRVEIFRRGRLRRRDTKVDDNPSSRKLLESRVSIGFENERSCQLLTQVGPKLKYPDEFLFMSVEEV